MSLQIPSPRLPFFLLSVHPFKFKIPRSPHFFSKNPNPKFLNHTDLSRWFYSNGELDISCEQDSESLYCSWRSRWWKRSPHSMGFSPRHRRRRWSGKLLRSPVLLRSYFLRAFMIVLFSVIRVLVLWIFGSWNWNLLDIELKCIWSQFEVIRDVRIMLAWISGKNSWIYDLVWCHYYRFSILSCRIILYIIHIVLLNADTLGLISNMLRFPDIEIS